MSRFLSPAIAGIVLLLFCVPTPSTAQDPGAIAGRVVTAAGEPAPGAAVSLVDLRRRTHAGADARFELAGVPPGSYLVQAVSRRHGSGQARIEVAPGATVEVEIRLELSSQVDEIVVTAGGEARSRLDLAQPVSVLGGEELGLRLAPTLGETLAQEPGVSSTYFGPGASRPVIRGLGGDRVRVLQEGIGTNDASSTSADHAVSVDAGVAERIEVLRGPATLLYGSSAIGGVVNVIDGAIPEYATDDALSGSLELRGGTAADERSGSLGLDGGHGRWAWHVSGLRRVTGDLAVPGGTVANSDVETASASAGASHFFGDRGFLGIAVSGFDSEYGLPGGHGEEDEHDDEDVRIDLEQRRLDLKGRVSAPFGAFDALKVRFGAGDYRHVELEGGEIGTSFFNDEWEGRLELVQRQRGSWRGSLGLQARHRDFVAIGEEAFVPASKTRSWAVFAFEEWELGRLTFQLGGRFESQELDPEGALPDRGFDGVSASAGLVWKVDDGHSVAVSLARSTKLPNAEELYSDGPHVATRTFEIGDPGLDQETSLGLDVSLRRQSGRFTGELTFFVTRFDDFIFQTFTGGEEDGLPVVRYVQDDAVLAGAELESRFELWHGGSSHLDLQLFGDYVEAELRATGEPLPRMPPLRYGAGLHYHGDRLHGMLEVRRTDGQDRLAAHETATAGFTFVNASVSYRTFRGSKIYDLLLRGRNLTDEEGRNHVSFLKDEVPLPGRDVSLAVRLWF